MGYSETGRVYEQQVELTFEDEKIRVRRIVVELKKATRNGDKRAVPIHEYSKR